MGRMVIKPEYWARLADAEVQHQDGQRGGDYQAHARNLAVGQLLGDQSDESVAPCDGDLGAVAPPKPLNLGDQLLKGVVALHRHRNLDNGAVEAVGPKDEHLGEARRVHALEQCPGSPGVLSGGADAAVQVVEGRIHGGVVVVAGQPALIGPVGKHRSG